MSRTAKPWMVAGLVVALAGGLVSMPATTKQGVNFTVTVYRLPWYVKTLRFLDRHREYRTLAAEATQGAASDRDRVLAVSRWTRTHIRPTPEGFPVVDDHILHIIIRGYGQPDQMADVFTTLTVYAGVPAFWRRVRMTPTDPGVVLSFVRLGEGWTVFDVAQGVAFLDDIGHPAGVSYRRYLERVQPIEPPPALRAQLQMPWPRLGYELKRAAHLIEVEDATADPGFTTRTP